MLEQDWYLEAADPDPDPKPDLSFLTKNLHIVLTKMILLIVNYPTYLHIS